MSSLVEIALKYLEAGFSPIPLVPGEKYPSIKEWQKHGTESLRADQIEGLFRNTDSIGLVMGFGGLEALDIDSKHFEGQELEQFESYVNQEAPGLLDSLLTQRTRSGGLHLIYRCESPEGNQKLAKNSIKEVTFETRGTGGQIASYPSPGYSIKNNTFNQVPTITMAEREILFSGARLTDTSPALPAAVLSIPSSRPPSNDQDLTPWQDYNQRKGPLEVLLSYGWTVVREDSEKIYVKRPGDTTAKDSGRIFKDKNLFFCWTTSTDFDAEKGYNAFQVLTILKYFGDFGDAARGVRSEGYGKQIKKDYDYRNPTNDFNYELVDKRGEPTAMEILEQFRVDSTKVVEKEPSAITLRKGFNDVYTLGTFGNFSLIGGKAKAKKSFFIASVCAAALRGEPKERDGLIGHLGERKVVYIDTEMGDYHVSKQKERINLMASLNIKENTDRFEFFAFRKCESNAQRMALIELAIKTVDNIGLLIIDGIADVSTKGINDEEEATMISSKLLKWTADYNMHVVTVLHQNKQDDSLRGHLGSYLCQKAETVISLTKDEHDNNSSMVEPVMTRNMEFPTLRLEVVQEEGIAVAQITFEDEILPSAQRVITLKEMPQIAASVDGMYKNTAIKNIKVSENIGMSKAEDLVIEMLQRGFLKESPGGNKTKVFVTGARPTSDQIQREENNNLQKYAPDLEDDYHCPF